MSQDPSHGHGTPSLPVGAMLPAGTPGIADTLVRGGAVGALIGAAAVLARNVAPLRAGTVSPEQATREVLVGAGKSGLATGLGAAVAGAIRGGPVVSALAMVATGAAALYALERPARAARAEAAEAEAESDETAKPAPGKSTARSRAAKA
ncbi:magnetosome protein MamC [Roseospirillum parvum]|uniref:Uncharacterized protein n=1 Tax=Roseospirillum parvum TaxID=83401 RepID=A0A1G7UPG2_9PROT|nr:magnetosome protein MamC [Roseospirillum parvum]SDG49396.1 hypothetical protein SAMN05421742_101393 [Roseospirillum parvum]